MAKTTYALDFKKVASLPSSGMTAGTIYFADDTNLLWVATSATEATCYSGIRNVTYDTSTNILSFTKGNGATVDVDFSEIVTETQFTNLLNFLGAVKRDDGTYAFETSGNGIADTSYLNVAGANTVKGALKILDSKIHDVEAAAGVISIGGQSGAITLLNGGTANGAINLTMSGQRLDASIVGLKSAAFTDSSEYDASGAAAAVLGTSDDASTDKTVYGLDKKIDAIKADSSVSLVKESTADEGYIATYTLSQGTTQVGKINIPKDYLVKSGEIKTVTTAGEPYSGAVVGDKYLDFTVNTYDTTTGSGTESHIYIPVKDLVDVYTGGNTAAINVSVGSSNVITATLNDNAVTTSKITDGNVTTEKLDASVQAALAKANNAVQSVTGETAVANSSYVEISVEAATDSGKNVTLSSHANVTTKDVSTASASSDGLATAFDVQQYVQQYVAEQLRWSEFHM